MAGPNIAVVVQPTAWTVTVTDGTNTSTHTITSGTSAQAAQSALAAHKTQFNLSDVGSVSIQI